jgi:flagellar hook-associated protein 2
MAVTGITSSSLLTALSQSGTSVARSTAQTATSKAADSSPAYLLSLGEQQNKAALLGYDRLGKLVGQADSSLAAMDRDNPAVIATIGGGTPLAESHSLDVQQLAQAQVLTSGAYGSANQSLASAGTLVIQTGTYDASSGTFLPAGDPMTVSITDGSLTGVAAAINGAKAGVTA